MPAVIGGVLYDDYQLAKEGMCIIDNELQIIKNISMEGLRALIKEYKINNSPTDTYARLIFRRELRRRKQEREQLDAFIAALARPVNTQRL